LTEIETISQAGAPRHDNCVGLPVSWTTYYTTLQS